MSIPLPRRSLLRSLAGLLAVPFLPRGTDTKPAGGGQPAPVRAQVAYLDVGGRSVTAISRTWRNGDESRCRLCDRCFAVNGQCLNVFSVFIPKKDARLFSAAGASIQPPPPQPG